MMFWESEPGTLQALGELFVGQARHGFAVCHVTDFGRGKSRILDAEVAGSGVADLYRRWWRISAWKLAVLPGCSDFWGSVGGSGCRAQ